MLGAAVTMLVLMAQWSSTEQAAHTHTSSAQQRRGVRNPTPCLQFCTFSTKQVWSRTVPVAYKGLVLVNIEYFKKYSQL